MTAPARENYKISNLGKPTGSNLMRVQADSGYKAQCVYHPGWLSPCIRAQDGGGAHIITEGGQRPE